MATNDNVLFLQEAKAALREISAEKARIQTLDIESKRLEKSAKEEKKAQTDLIKLTLKKRKEELLATYDTELSRIKDKIKKETARRDKAIAAGKKARAKSETEELRKENKRLKQESKAMFKQEKLPAFCNTTLYYSLFFAKGMRELLIMVLTFLLVFLALPFGVYALVPQKGIGIVILIYVAVIAVFGGGFVFINEKTKMTHPAAIKQGRAFRDAIAANNRKIKKIEQGIANDANNSYYDLVVFDENLDKYHIEYDDIQTKKAEALDQYEKVTKRVITEEIMANSQGRIDNLTAKLAQVKDDLVQSEKQVREASMAFSNAYGTYIDKEYWQADKLDRLIEILNAGEAQSITEAQTVYKAKDK